MSFSVVAVVAVLFLLLRLTTTATTILMRMTEVCFRRDPKSQQILTK